MKGFILFISLGFLIGLVSFNETESDTYNTTNNLKPKGYTDKEINYFNEITLKNELNSRVKNSPRKFKKDVKIYIYGNPEEYMVREIMYVVSDLNYIIDPIDISLVKDKRESNITVFFGGYNSFISNNLDLIRVQELKSCEGFFTCKSNGSNEITSSRVFINLPNQDGIDDVRDVIREEITQSLGFFNDGTTYPESCFYEGQNKVFEYPEIDVKLISHLYND
jgi:hypothetical protein